MACILLCSAVRVHDSQAYRKMDVTRERISHILELREILRSFQTEEKLEMVTSFKYLGSVITDEGSKPEIPSGIAQTTAALTRQ